VSKIIDSLVQTSIDSKNYTGVVLVKMHFDPIVRVCSSYQTIYWDEAGGGELEYTGLGNLASISVLTESGELGAQTIQLTLSGVPADTVTDIFSDEYINQPVYIWYGTLDPDTYAVEGGQNGPVLIFAGRMDFGSVEFGKAATITVNATSRLADWDRPRGGRFNHAYQTRHVDSNDFAFRYVQKLQNKPISWGGVTIQDPGSGGVGPGGPGDEFGGGGDPLQQPL